MKLIDKSDVNKFMDYIGNSYSFEKEISYS